MKKLPEIIRERIPVTDRKDFLWLWGRVVEEHNTERRGWLRKDTGPKYRAIVWTETDMLEGLPTVVKLWATGKFGHLIISGGDYGNEKKRGCLPSVDMLSALVRECCRRKLPVRGISIDNYSKHTGWQGTVLSRMLKFMPDPDKPGFVKIKEVVFVAPRYHILRFTLSLIRGLQHEKMKVRVYTAPFGTWSTWHPQKKAKYWDLFWNSVGKEGNEIGKIYKYQKFGDILPLEKAMDYLDQNIGLSLKIWHGKNLKSDSD